MKKGHLNKLKCLLFSAIDTSNKKKLVLFGLLLFLKSYFPGEFASKYPIVTLWETVQARE